MGITHRGGCIALIFALGSAVCLLACGSSPDPAEVHPGDPQYPAENPHASAIVQFTAVVPSTLHPVFSIGYLGLATGCLRKIGGGAASRPPGFNVPVNLTLSGGVYRGTFATDRFEPGGCNWQFAGLGYETRNPAAYGGILLRYAQRLGPDAVRLDIWCARVPLSKDHPEFCNSLQFLANGHYGASPDTLAAAPEDERGDAEATIGPNTRTVIVEFHDVDASLTLTDRQGARPPIGQERQFPVVGWISRKRPVALS